MIRSSVRCTLAALRLAAVALAATVAAGQQGFSFQILPGPSGIDVQVDLSVPSDGTLVGDYDGETNPAGTRTKPGLFGSFGPTENVPVPASLGFELGGNPQSDAAGAFEALIDPEAGAIRLSGLSADLLSSGPVMLSAQIELEFDSFRTRSPDSTYIGIPVSLPLDDVTLVALLVQQVGQAEGVLTPQGPGVYTFEAPATIAFSATVQALGNEVVLPPTPGIVPLVGEVTVTGQTARVSARVPIQIAGMTDPGLPLPTLPLDLPTVLPPGGTAHLLLDLVVGEASYSFDGTLMIEADGVAGCASDPCDANCDGAIDAFDIEPFINVLVGGGTPCSECAGDVNADGVVDAFDIEPFIACLLP